jgi:hypothetical protein
MPETAVPKEFSGKARVLVNKLRAQDDGFSQAVKDIYATLMLRYLEKRPQRPEGLADAARRYRTKLPAEGRLDLNVKLDRKSLHIHELRARGFTYSRQGYSMAQPGVSVGRITISADRFNKPVFLWAAPVFFTHHAISRYFERELRASEAGFWGKARDLAHAADDMIAGAKPDKAGRIRAAHDGWRCEVFSRPRMGGTIERYLSVITYTGDRWAEWGAADDARHRQAMHGPRPTQRRTSEHA